MRVITGLYKGRRLIAPKGHEIRPTIERLKESYFNIVHGIVHGSYFLDLCAGTGSMGIEALSRGAKKVTFVEKSHNAVAVIKKNLDICGIRRNFKIIEEDLFKQIPRFGSVGQKFDLIYFDPPYFKELYSKALILIDQTKTLSSEGVLTTNHFKKIELPDLIGNLRRYRIVKHGDSVLSFYSWEGSQIK